MRLFWIGVILKLSVTLAVSAPRSEFQDCLKPVSTEEDLARQLGTLKKAYACAGEADLGLSGMLFQGAPTHTDSFKDRNNPLAKMVSRYFEELKGQLPPQALSELLEGYYRYYDNYQRMKAKAAAGLKRTRDTASENMYEQANAKWDFANSDFLSLHELTGRKADGKERLWVLRVHGGHATIVSQAATANADKSRKSTAVTDGEVGSVSNKSGSFQFPGGFLAVAGFHTYNKVSPKRGEVSALPSAREYGQGEARFLGPARTPAERGAGNENATSRNLLNHAMSAVCDGEKCTDVSQGCTASSPKNYSAVQGIYYNTMVLQYNHFVGGR